MATEAALASRWPFSSFGEEVPALSGLRARGVAQAKARPAGASRPLTGMHVPPPPPPRLTPQAPGAGLLRVRPAAPQKPVLTLMRSSRSAYQAARPNLEG